MSNNSNLPETQRKSSSSSSSSATNAVLSSSTHSHDGDEKDPTHNNTLNNNNSSKSSFGLSNLLSFFFFFLTRNARLDDLFWVGMKYQVVGERAQKYFKTLAAKYTELKQSSEAISIKYDGAKYAKEDLELALRELKKQLVELKSQLAFYTTGGLSSENNNNNSNSSAPSHSRRMEDFLPSASSSSSSSSFASNDRCSDESNGGSKTTILLSRQQAELSRLRNALAEQSSAATASEMKRQTLQHDNKQLVSSINSLKAECETMKANLQCWSTFSVDTKRRLNNLSNHEYKAFRKSLLRGMFGVLCLIFFSFWIITTEMMMVAKPLDGVPRILTAASPSPGRAIAGIESNYRVEKDDSPGGALVIILCFFSSFVLSCCVGWYVLAVNFQELDLGFEDIEKKIDSSLDNINTIIVESSNVKQ